MPRFLSPGWLDELAGTAREVAVPATGEDGGSRRLVLQQVVTGGPEGDVRYVVRLEGEGLTVEPGVAADADLTFEADWATAAAMAQGRLGAQDAFAAGRLRVGGDAAVLLRHASVLVALGDAFAAVRDRTEW